MRWKIGTVTHYYDKLGVAIVDLIAPLCAGDTIRIFGSTEFSQTIEDMQVEHEKISSANEGETVGIKMNQPVCMGDEIVKIN